MGSFLSFLSFASKKCVEPVIVSENGLVNDAVASLKAQVPDCVVTTIALKEEDVYVPQNLGLNHYVITYDAASQRVIRVYSDEL